MYAHPKITPAPNVTFQSLYGRPRKHAESGQVSDHFRGTKHLSTSYQEPVHAMSPSGAFPTSTILTSFEKEQHELLDRLIKNLGTSPLSNERESHISNPNPAVELADEQCAHSFSFPVDDSTFQETTPNHRNFTRGSVDDINTRFVDEEPSPAWKFSAGSAELGGSPVNRSPAGSRTGRRSPPKRPTGPANESANVNVPSEPPESKFDAEGWSDKFGPHTFVPQPVATNTSSPTRASRTNSKKTKPAKPAGFSVPGEVSSDEDTYEWRGRKGPPVPEVAESPQAMDIDSPMNEPAVPSSPQPQSARNIHVEPSRPDWRSGEANVQDAEEEIKPEDPVKKKFQANAVGSEDSEEFRANFNDLKNVAPMTQEASGLKSFGDLKDTLPFDSQASGAPPIKLPKAQPLVFPNPPTAPRLPPTVAISGLKPNMSSWEKYLKEFEAYLQQWDMFNRLVVDHFMTRKLHITQSRNNKGYGFLGSRGDNDVREYYNWVQQDNEVRRKWTEACEEHEKRFREFMAFRERMK